MCLLLGFARSEGRSDFAEVKDCGKCSTNRLTLRSSEIVKDFNRPSSELSNPVHWYALTLKTWKEQMKILVSNDDGWDAPGIKLLETVLEEVAEVWTVAPASPQSGISHQMTFEQPMQLTQVSDRRFHLSGTPADCTRVGLTQLGVKFDWVFSGVNNGGNLGVDFYISGTVAAAREATFFGMKAVALSQHRLNYPALFDWDAVRPLLRRVVDDLLNREGFNRGDLVNVNLPDCTNRDASKVEIVDCEMDKNPLPYDYGIPPEQTPSTADKVSSKTLLYRGKYNDRKRMLGRDVAVCLGGNISAVSIRAENGS